MCVPACHAAGPWGSTERRRCLFTLTLTEDTQVSLLSSAFPDVPMWLGHLSTHFNSEFLSSRGQVAQGWGYSAHGL